ncbi:IS1595 family transposase [Endozoicomonas ascidiicola]|uniref:IS1595 family transposase n=1 Tax=Endozoicomonas ascidiicola TaxID=1698521 RepID=UPI000833B6E8|nr:IS1595 family transposase [Endozoicomonas ascidiicola]
MQSQQFADILRSVPLMSPEQVGVLHKTLPPAAHSAKPDAQGESRLLERLKFYFDQHPVCVRCRSTHVNRWGTKDGHQRYCCKDCSKTFNAMSGTPLSHLRVREKLDQYVECMDGETTLRPAARRCGISLDTSFHLRHRLMALVENDSYGQLSGIAEEDETFFHESHKGDRNLLIPRKRGSRGQRKSRYAKAEKKISVPLIPVMVACDRSRHVLDAVLKKVSTKELQSQLEGKILPGSTLCLDAHLAHEHLAEKLSLSSKTLVSTSGERVKEGIYHIQTVNAYHSELKRWINGFFKGVATKYLQRYLGWKRYLKTHMFSIEGFLDQISIHWTSSTHNLN